LGHNIYYAVQICIVYASRGKSGKLVDETNVQSKKTCNTGERL